MVQRPHYLALCCYFIISRYSFAFSTPKSFHVAPFTNKSDTWKIQTQLRVTYSSDASSSESQKSRQARKRPNQLKRKWLANNGRRRNPDELRYNIRRAEEVEQRLTRAMECLQDVESDSSTSASSEAALSHSGNSDDSTKVSFPSARDCNGALAAYGDAGDFTRAIKLFEQMRKATDAVSTYSSLSGSGRLYLVPPAPTLVTYSTLMSRAVSLGKEKVALRLWRLMISCPSFYANRGKADVSFGAPIVPDIKAVNILMNVFAKMGDQASAKRLMEQIYDGKVVAYDTSIETNRMTEIDDGDFESASGPEDLGLSLIQVVPKMEPNIVTYNTLINASHRAGDLDAGLEALNQMKQNTNIVPDIFTYTSLISSVARRTTRSNGKSDPDLAFELFDEMVNKYQIKANGMAYCALIDVCGRCGRSDLALKGLRMMLREKAQRQYDEKQKRKNKNYKSKGPLFRLANEVGAWTAAIDACGKAGRLETAIRLFQTMPKFGVYPNIYTCGALTDCLLKSKTENYLNECLNVLRYMKEEGIEPSEVMYTSLITSASKLAKQANEERGEIVLTDFGDRSRVSLSNDENEKQGRMKALDVYTELIRSLTNHDVVGYATNKKMRTKQGRTDVSDELLMKVFLVLQEMKASGADPDIACYNAILRACARAGDISKLRDVLRRIELDGLVPNATTWKETIRGASIARDSTMAERMWKMALSQEDDNLEGSYSDEKWTPGIEEFDLLITSYIREAAKAPEKMECLYSKVLDAYIGVANGEERFGLHHIDLDDVKNKPRTVKMISQATAFLRSTCTDADVQHLPVLESNIRQAEIDFGLAP
eukprot:scaffold2589_cov273-Chaetoceros_neogracile.AAC.7